MLTKQNEALGSAIKKAARNALLTADAMKQADVIHAAATAPEDAVKTRLAEFIQKSGCTVVAADKADMTQLIKMYFDLLPPFEASGEEEKRISRRHSSFNFGSMGKGAQ